MGSRMSNGKERRTVARSRGQGTGWVRDCCHGEDVYEAGARRRIAIDSLEVRMDGDDVTTGGSRRGSVAAVSPMPGSCGGIEGR